MSRLQTIYIYGVMYALVGLNVLGYRLQLITYTNYFITASLVNGGTSMGEGIFSQYF